MTVSINVVDGKPFYVSAVLPRIRSTVSTLLGLRYEPELRTEITVIGDQTCLDHMECNRYCGFDVFVENWPSVTTVLSDRGFDDFIISPYGKTAYAIAAAVAIVLAEHSGSEIDDAQPVYSGYQYHKPGDFAQLIKVDGPFDDFDKATEAFLQHKFELTGRH